MENKELKVSDNAGAIKRSLGFFIDNIIINFLVALCAKCFIFTKGNIEKINNCMDEFNRLFGSVKISDLKDFHIRYIVNSDVFKYFLLSVFLVFFVGVIYNFLSYVLLNSSTIGQKIFSLRVVNMKNYDKPNVFKMLLKSILVQLPADLLRIMFIGQLLFLINFHMYAPINNFATLILVKIVSVSNIYTIGIVSIFFFLFWFDIYYITNRLILSDIISRTRVVNSKILDFKNKDKKDLVYLFDKFFDMLEKLNSVLKKQLIDWIEFLKSRFKKNK